MDRRFFIGGAATALVSTVARADDEFRGDDGKPAPTWRLPSDISLDLPGVIVAGGKSPDAILYEFFDYNCPWCKKSAPDLHKLVSGDRDFSLILVQNAILSLGSVQAAKVAMAARAIYDDKKAYALHRAMLGHRGPLDGMGALDHAKKLGLDAKALEEKADGGDMRKQLSLHVQTGRALAMDATPSFAMNGMGVGGWPGPKTIARMVKNVRACERIAC
ncbi:MAG TPA: DsbA family protein [Rhodoblastus sp.]|nr:DsbA family protein [Rhodoblastus sp.]